MTARSLGSAAVLAALAGSASLARAQDDPPLPTPPSFLAPVAVDSGVVRNDAPGWDPAVVFSTVVEAPGAVWLRLMFDEATLAGDPGNGAGSYLRITSIGDGAVQELRANHVEQWRNTSAYFNGERVLIELVAFPRTGDNRLVMTKIVAGEPVQIPESLCEGADNRTLLNDPRAARHMPTGCTAWLFSDLNHQFLTAGHCNPQAGHVMQFNVPFSTAAGSPVAPPPEDQYVVDFPSSQRVSGGVGNDWGYHGCLPNSNTGLTAYQAQGAAYTLANAPAGGSNTIRITGYGSTAAPVDPRWYLVGKTHTGPYMGLAGTNVRYHVDTTGGNSGSPVYDEVLGASIGIHTHAGCNTSPTSYNNGTAIQIAGLQNALNNPASVCRTGRGTPGGIVFAAGDLANNFGTVSATAGQFARVSLAPNQIQGMAYDWDLDRFYAADRNLVLYALDPSGGAPATIATITGTGGNPITGLGYDQDGNVLYGIAGATGQLYRINTATGAATAIGTPRGNNVGALDFDPESDTLYGLDDATAGSRLIRVNTATGVQTVVGSLGALIADCNGLAYNDADNMLYTINSGNEQALRINPATGAAAVVGATNGVFDAMLGMACRLTRPPCPADLDGDGFVTGDDFTLFVTWFEAGDLRADFDGDGFLTGDDFTAYVIAFEAGC